MHLLLFSNNIKSFLRATFSDPDSFNLFCFLSLNLTFAFVELFYGLWTNSLGLISDSFHMFFDCSALLTGLVASVITRWPKTRSFTFGFGRAEIMAGLVNALFLIFISFFIFKEAVERVFDQPHIHQHRLFLVSVLGLFVNLVGIFVFHHGQSGGGACCHSGHSHNHGPRRSTSHSHLPQVPAQGDAVVIAISDPHASACCNHAKTDEQGCVGCRGRDHQEHNHDHRHNFNCDHDHHHCHTHGRRHDDVHDHNHGFMSGGIIKGNQIIRGVFLHVLADTLGSVAVIVSSFLITHFKFMIADTLCSMFCSVLIFISALPLLWESASILMERVPRHIEQQVFETFDHIRKLPGIYNITEQHVWSLCTAKHFCAMKLMVAPSVDSSFIMQRARSAFQSVGISEVIIEVERAY